MHTEKEAIISESLGLFCKIDHVQNISGADTYACEKERERERESARARASERERERERERFIEGGNRAPVVEATHSHMGICFRKRPIAAELAGTPWWYQYHNNQPWCERGL